MLRFHEQRVFGELAESCVDVDDDCFLRGGQSFCKEGCIFSRTLFHLATAIIQSFGKFILSADHALLQRVQTVTKNEVDGLHDKQIGSWWSGWIQEPVEVCIGRRCA